MCIKSFFNNIGNTYNILSRKKASSLKSICKCKKRNCKYDHLHKTSAHLLMKMSRIYFLKTAFSTIYIDL